MSMASPPPTSIKCTSIVISGGAGVSVPETDAPSPTETGLISVQVGTKVRVTVAEVPTVAVVVFVGGPEGGNWLKEEQERSRMENTSSG